MKRKAIEEELRFKRARVRELTRLVREQGELVRYLSVENTSLRKEIWRLKTKIERMMKGPPWNKTTT